MHERQQFAASCLVKVNFDYSRKMCGNCCKHNIDLNN